VPAEPIEIAVLNSPSRVPVNEPVALHLVITCPTGGRPAELRQIACLKPKSVELDTDLFERDLVLRSGEEYRCVVTARFLTMERHTDPVFYVQVGRDTDSWRVRVPTPTIQVIPSFTNELQVTAESICTYEHGTKVDLAVTHTGLTRFDDFRLLVTPVAAVRAGVSDQRLPAFSRGDTIKFTTVVTGAQLELTVDGTVGGERVGPVSFPVAVPAVHDIETNQFRFLEPKKLTQAAIRLFTMDEERADIPYVSGSFTVYGGGEKYRVEIKPAHPHAQEVKLRGASGVVEVTEMPPEAGTWAFQMVVVSNAVFTTSVALHFDVLTPDGAQQGELNLSIRPRNSKLWIVAATAGAAVTVKGAAAVVPAVLSPNDPMATFQAALMKVNNLWDLLQLCSIPGIRAGLWLIDRILRPFQDD
jgi:hypothetical protein